MARFDELADAVRQVASGGTVLDPVVVEALFAQPRSAATLNRLTRREREVIGELATGFSNRTIAQRMVLSQRAVEKHINSIFAKLELTPTSCRSPCQGCPDVPRRRRIAMTAWGARSTTVVRTPSFLANRAGTMARWRTSCAFGSSTTSPASGATAATLATMDDFVMAGECETGESAIEQIPDGDADIVLMDIHMPEWGNRSRSTDLGCTSGRDDRPDVHVRRRGPSRFGVGLRRRFVSAQGTPVS